MDPSTGFTSSVLDETLSSATIDTYSSTTQPARDITRPQNQKILPTQRALSTLEPPSTVSEQFVHFTSRQSKSYIFVLLLSPRPSPRRSPLRPRNSSTETRTSMHAWKSWNALRAVMSVAHQCLAIASSSRRRVRVYKTALLSERWLRSRASGERRARCASYVEITGIGWRWTKVGRNAE
jgi:hypothetical protein